MKQLPPIKITISGADDGNMEITMNPQATIEDYMDIFKVMLMYQGFHIATILEYLDIDERILNEEVGDVS